MQESKKLEFKQTLTNSFLKTVSAYANFGDGMIIFGISNDGEVIGVDDPKKFALNIENKINDNLNPTPDFELTIDETECTIRLSVFEGSSKPYFYKNKAYKRADTATIEVDRTELNRLILEGTNRSFESLPSKLNDLSFQTLEQKMIETLQIEGLTSDILKTLNLFSDKEGYNIAAELLSDQNTFPGIDIVLFGNSIDEFKDREIINQTSIINQFETGLRMFSKNYSTEVIDGKRRNRQFSIPEKAFREALANALVHRTWDISSAIMVSMYPDHIEISSPGGLPYGISKEEYLSGQISMLRNPIIGNIFFRLKYIEMFGTGIKRINTAYASSYQKPEFKIFDNSIIVILPKTQESIDIFTLDEQRVFESLSINMPKTRSEIQEVTNLSKDKIIRVLNRLIEKNAIQRKGKGRGTAYTKK